MSEDFEFQISQYVDGTLSAEERAAVEVRLAEDADARQLLGEYRRLNEQLSRNLSLPNVKWDRLADHLSAAMDETPAVAGRIGFATWGWRVAIAACLAIAVGVTLHHFGAPRPLPLADVDAMALVTGPAAESADGTPIEEIAVGPSADIASHGGSQNFSQSVVAPPSRAVIISAAPLSGS